MKLVLGLKTAAGAVVLAGALLSACVVAPAPGYYGGYVAASPPAPQVELVGEAPAPGYVWFGGYWNWVGGRHVWVPGRWTAGRPGYRWVPHTWVHAGEGWRMSPGHWSR